MQNDININNFLEFYDNFPTKGIRFADISPLISNPTAFEIVIEKMSEEVLKYKIEAIIGIEARGFIFASAIALNTKLPLIMARKKGKLPGEVFKKSYKYEYAKSTIEIKKSEINKFNKFCIVDDVLATGNTNNAIFNILNKEKNNPLIKSVFLIEIKSIFF